MPRVVILGVSTGVGKTWVTVALVSALGKWKSAGQVLALKPFESGLCAVPGVGERPPPGSDAARSEYRDKSGRVSAVARNERALALNGAVVGRETVPSRYLRWLSSWCFWHRLAAPTRGLAIPTQQSCRVRRKSNAPRAASTTLHRAR